MVSTSSPCRTIDRTFLLSFSLPEIEEINQEYKIIEERKGQRYMNPLMIALRMEKIIMEGGITKAELSRIIGISRARITQYMNLLRLSPEVKKKIIAKGEKMGTSERKLKGFDREREEGAD